MIYEFMPLMFLEYQEERIELEKGGIFTSILSEFENNQSINTIKDIVGEVHFLNIFSGKPGFVYKSFELVNNTEDSQVYLEQETFISSTLVQNILLNSWFIKDNAMNSGGIYGIVLQNKVVLYSYIFNHDLFSNSKGKFFETSFTKVDFLKIIEYKNKIVDTSSKSLNTSSDISNEIKNRWNNNQIIIEEEKITRFLHYGKFMRSYEFVKEARKTSFIPGKLSNYCSALETLVVFDKDGITSQIKNNTKKLLDYFEPGNEISKRKIDKIYNSRSIYVHGDSYTDLESDKLVGYSEDIDGILRIILRGILDNNLQDDVEEMNNKEMKEWIEKL